MNCDIDFDERFFINLNGLQHTPIKLVSPLMNNHSSSKALQQHSSTSGHKSPLNKGSMGAMAAQNHQTFKRARAYAVPL